MANLTRRQWLKVGLAVGGMVTFGLSYRDVAKRAIDGLLDGTSGKITRDRIFCQRAHPRSQRPASLAAKPATGDLDDAVLWLLDAVWCTGSR